MPSETVTLPITGMSCANCALNLERSLKRLEGIKETGVNFAAEQASFLFDPEKIRINDLVKQIQDAGYGIAAARVELPITGMTCANCAMNIERTLNTKISGVIRASVNFASERAMVEYLPTMTNLNTIVDAIGKAGFAVILPDQFAEGEDVEQRARRAEIADQTKKFLVGLIFTAPLFVWSMGRDFGLLGMWSHAL